MTDQQEMSIGDLHAYTGIPIQTLRRRIDLWIEEGDRSERAIEGYRTSGTTGDRRVPRREAERILKIKRGELSPYTTAAQYAASQG